MSYACCLSDFLIAIGQGERNLESHRQALGGLQDYDAGTSFARMDRDSNNEITA